MSIFNNQRLTIFSLDLDGLRQGYYSDKYFDNTTRMLEALHSQGYTFQGNSPRLPAHMVNALAIGDMTVEMQWFTRRQPFALVGGVDYALALLHNCTGYYDDEGGDFINTWNQLQVQAVQDGIFVHHQGDPMNVQPVLRVRGIYRHFARLQTPILGAMSRISRIATNVYELLEDAKGKPLLFLPARYELHHTQAADGYAYHLGVERYNLDHAANVPSFISTDAQGAWWGSEGSGTMPHAVIACFLADSVEAMQCFAATQPPEVPRIALVDFNNDSVGTALAITQAMFEQYRELTDAGQTTEADKYRLFGVRLDTDNSLRDLAVDPIGDPQLDLGVNPRLVMATRRALDRAWESWDLPSHWEEEAQLYCRDIKIIASGNFSREKIRRFERLGIPVDMYGIGSSFMINSPRTNADFSADVVRVKVDDTWVNMSKIGRRPCDNPDLEPVTF